MRRGVGQLLGLSYHLHFYNMPRPYHFTTITDKLPTFILSPAIVFNLLPVYYICNKTQKTKAFCRHDFMTMMIMMMQTLVNSLEELKSNVKYADDPAADGEENLLYRP